MRKSLCLVLLPAGAGLFPSAASAATAADVKVNFIAPERFYDASLYGGYGAHRYERTVKELEKIFQELATRYLGPGEQIAIDVLNVDLAGEYHPYSLYAYDVRMMTEITWPRIRLRYVLTRPNDAPLSGEEVLIDQNYMTFSGFRSGGSRTLSYERVMLDRWFKSRFAARPTPAPG